MRNRKSSLKLPERLRNQGAYSSPLRRGISFTGLIAVLGMAAGWQNAYANWEFKPTVGVGATYTDNINLAIESAAEDELVFEVDPSFTLNNNSKNWQVSLDYMMENLFFTRDSSNNETYHSLNASSLSTLIPDELTVAINSRFYQQIIDAEGSVRYSNISTSGNYTDAWVNSISPQWVHNFGSRFVGRVAYQFSSTNYLDRADDGRSLNDVETQTVSAGFGSQQRAGRPSWDVAYSYQRAEPDMAREFEYERLALTAEYPISDNLVLTGEGGAESDVLMDSSVAGLEEGFGEVGLRWIRGERTTIEAAAGHRFFGTSYRGSITHAGKRLTLSAGYSEEVSTFALLQIDLDSMSFFDANALGDPLQGIDDRVFVSKSFNASASWAMPRGDFRVAAFDNRREFVDGSDDRSKLTGISGGAVRNLGPRTDLTLDVVWYRTEPGGSEPDGFEHSRLTAGVSRALGRSLNATANVRRATRSADFFGREFEELAASVFFSWTP